MMTWILIGGLLIIAVAGIYYLSRMHETHGGVPEPVEGCKNAATGGCCGGVNCDNKHRKPTIIYFEDEELDRFRHRNGRDYTEEEVSEWKEIAYTLRPDEISPWLKSVGLRGLHVPQEILNELNRH